MERIYTFLEFHNDSFNRKMMSTWINLFDCKDTDIPITENMLGLLNEKYSTIKNLKKLMKINNINYNKINENITITSQNFKRLLMSHGNDDVIMFLSTLPQMVKRYDSYLIDKKIELSKSFSL